MIKSIMTIATLSFALSAFAVDYQANLNVNKELLEEMNKLDEDFDLINNQVQLNVDYAQGSDCIIEFEFHGLKFTNDHLCKINETENQ